MNWFKRLWSRSAREGEKPVKKFLFGAGSKLTDQKALPEPKLGAVREMRDHKVIMSDAEQQAFIRRTLLGPFD